MNNSEIRAWYVKEVCAIADVVEQMGEGVALPDRARRAFEVRRKLRLKAREMMEDPFEAELLRKRDLKKYGNPDGPSFEQLLQNKTIRGLSEEDAYLSIIRSASRTDTAISERVLGMPRRVNFET